MSSRPCEGRPRPITREAKRRLAQARGRVERVEPRRLLATLSGGILQITGNTESEAFTVVVSGPDLVVTRNAEPGQHFVKTSVTQIRASLGAGNDSIRLGFDVTAPASLNGEAGNDTLVGGAGSDTLDGGSGNDSLNGGGEDANGSGSAGFVDRNDLVTYASRDTPVTATLELDLIGGIGGFGQGTGGGVGETDTYSNVEAIAGGAGADTLTLSARSFSSVTGAGTWTVRALGGGGNDTLRMGSGFTQFNDPLQFALFGEAGNDLLDFTENRDPQLPLTLNGGDGNDTFAGNSDDGDFTAGDGGAGTDLLREASGIHTSYALPTGVEDFFSGFGHFTVTGNDLNNRITIGDGAFATVLAGNGNDTVVTGHNDDVVDGGNGDDCIVAGDGDDCLRGGAGNDAIDPGAGNDSVNGGSGGDAVSYATSTIPVVGTINALLVLGGSGASKTYAVRHDVTATQTAGGVKQTDVGSNVEVLSGSAANDELSALISPGDWAGAAAAGYDRSPLIVNGEGGSDRLLVRGALNAAGTAVADVPALLANGNDGNDAIQASQTDAAKSRIDGGNGDDVLVYGAPVGLVAFAGGGGHDTIKFNRRGATSQVATLTMPGDVEDAEAYSDVRVDIVGNALANRISVAAPLTNVRGLGGNDTIGGTGGADTLDGGDGNDQISGLGGNDSLLGGIGNDLLRGDDGNDRLDGGAGADSLYGGPGTDTAVKDPNDPLVREIEFLV